MAELNRMGTPCIHPASNRKIHTGKEVLNMKKWILTAFALLLTCALLSGCALLPILEKLTIEGCFNVVLHAKTDGQDHWFLTQSDGTDTAKSPEDMFPERIPNDLALVDKAIREYYGMEAV